MEVILLERIEKLGNMGDVVNVKPGFGRNFLLPQEKALRATKANLARFEAEREYLEQRNAENRDKAAADGAKLDGAKVILIRKAGDTGNLYGSVSARDIAESLEGQGVKRNMIVLEQPIKTLGLHGVKVKLHPEVLVDVEVNVARSEDEAERQAKGEDVIAAAMTHQKNLPLSNFSHTLLFDPALHHREAGFLLGDRTKRGLTTTASLKF